MNLRNPNWISVDIQANIDPPQILLIRVVTEKVKYFDIIKIKMLCDPASATSKTYEIKVPTFENGKPE